MRRAFVILLLLAVVLAGSCSSTGPAQYLSAAQLLLRQESRTAISERIGEYTKEFVWDEGEDNPSRLDEDRFPAWAREAYAACVHWEESFTREMFNFDRQRGEPETTFVSGVARAWILFTTGLDWHILELTVETEDQSFTWIDAWSEPPEEP